VTFVSEPLPLPLHPSGVPFKRADLHFHDLDHSGASYEGRVFLNNPAATLRTRRTIADGYAGSFHIFGHPHCWGDAGHCAVPPGPLHGFDHRPPHHLVPQLHTLDVTQAIRELTETSAREVTVSVLPVVRTGARSRIDDAQLRFSRLALVTYD
jgi:hypothetical protein